MTRKIHIDKTCASHMISISRVLFNYSQFFFRKFFTGGNEIGSPKLAVATGGLRLSASPKFYF